MTGPIRQGSKICPGLDGCSSSEDSSVTTDWEHLTRLSETRLVSDCPLLDREGRNIRSPLKDHHPPSYFLQECSVSLPVQETIAKSSLDNITRHVPWSHLFISSSSGRGHSAAEVTHQRETWTRFCIFLWKAYHSLQCLLLGKGTAHVLWEIKAR